MDKHQKSEERKKQSTHLHHSGLIRSSHSKGENLIPNELEIERERGREERGEREFQYALGTKAKNSFREREEKCGLAFELPSELLCCFCFCFCVCMRLSLFLKKDTKSHKQKKTSNKKTHTKEINLQVETI